MPMETNIVSLQSVIKKSLKIYRSRCINW